MIPVLPHPTSVAYLLLAYYFAVKIKTSGTIKSWCQFTRLLDIMLQKAVIIIVTVMRISKLKFLFIFSAYTCSENNA